MVPNPGSLFSNEMQLIVCHARGAHMLHGVSYGVSYYVWWTVERPTDTGSLLSNNLLLLERGLRIRARHRSAHRAAAQTPRKRVSGNALATVERLL
eukprot:scaffold171037_cov51-Attheya_sp.AAC.4